MSLVRVRHAADTLLTRLNPFGGSPLRLLLFGLADAVVLAMVLHVVYVTLGANFHTVLLGDSYRSAQPSTKGLESLIRDYNIHTVINLRGDNTDDWYFEEHALGQRLGVDVVDVGLWANLPPPADQFVLLVETLNQASPGVLIHCHSGGDRSGLGGALAILLRSNGTLFQARRQLSPYYGHNPLGKAGCLTKVLDRYEEWLVAHDWEHSSARLLCWAKNEYRPDQCQ